MQGCGRCVGDLPLFLQVVCGPVTSWVWGNPVHRDDERMKMKSCVWNHTLAEYCRYLFWTSTHLV